ncbi:uncharacterized protein LOC126843283 isoform X2 [Adelges cooleyi]|nr:uncharacterized protein LOC126843283 isoform X2 [Adelges cooleyi]
MQESFGIEKPEALFHSDSSNIDGADSVDLKNLLLALSYNDENRHECFKTEMLTPLEVEFFLNVFVEHANDSDQDGCLGLEQLRGVLKELKLNDRDIGRVVGKLQAKKKTDEFAVKEADFLWTLMEIKPKGNGLSLEQIEELNDVYNGPKTDTGGIEPEEIQKIFIEFNMADPKHESKMLFKSNRVAEKELMELALLTAERGRKVHVEDSEEDTEGKFMDPPLVRTFLSDFVSYDLNNDGFVSKQELSTWSELLKSISHPMPDSGYPQNDDDKINFAEFLKMMFLYYKKLEEETEPITVDADSDDD